MPMTTTCWRYGGQAPTSSNILISTQTISQGLILGRGQRGDPLAGILLVTTRDPPLFIINSLGRMLHLEGC